MNNIKLEGISKNLRYIFTNNGIYDFLDDKTYAYNLETFNSKGVKLVQEISQIEYKLNKINIQEYISEPRKVLYSITEIFQPQDSIKIIKEWEEKFGNKLLLINENQDKLIIEQKISEAWEGVFTIVEQFTDWVKSKYDSIKDKIKSSAKNNFDQLKQIKDKGFFNYAGEKIKKGWDWIKKKAMDAWKCLSDNFVECLMEGLRDAVLSPVGVAVEVFLTVTGVGAPVVMVIYGVLLLWDVYLLFNNYEKFQWLNIVLDIVGIVSSGTMVPIVRTAFKGINLFTKGGGKSFEFVAQNSFSKGGKIANFMRYLGDKLSKFGTKILDAIRQGAEWVSKNFKINFLKGWITKASGVLDNVKNSILNLTGGGGKTTGNLTKTAAKRAAFAGSGDYAVSKGVEGYGDYQSYKQGVENEKINDALTKSISGISSEDAEIAGLY
jgi:hypothetical protein